MRLTSVLAFVSSLAVPACAVDLSPTGPGDIDPRADDATGAEPARPVERIARTDLPMDPATFEARTQLALPLSTAPNAGASFDFCPSIGDASLNVRNAAWLAWISANEYAHFAFLAQPLSDLGFGRVSDGIWSLCGRDLAALRMLEARDAVPEELGSYFDEPLELGVSHDRWSICVRGWAEDAGYTTGETPRPRSLSAAFEHWLMQDVSDASGLQFFSAGELEVDGPTGKMVFEAGSTQVVWARHSSLPIVVVAFRGTELEGQQRWADVGTDAALWQTDFDLRTTSTGEAIERPAEWGDVHRGFLRAFREAHDDILRAKLASLSAAGERVQIWVTGHSLGAALATLFAAQVVEDVEHGAPYRLGGLYTFGSPRVGDHRFAERLQHLAARQRAGIWRFRHANDLVTGIPLGLPSLPSLGGIDYTHVGTTAHLRNGAMAIRPFFMPPPLSIADHGIEQYFNALKREALRGAFATCAVPPP